MLQKIPSEEVGVRIYGNSINEKYTKLLKEKPEYTRNKGLDKATIQQKIIQYLQNAGFYFTTWQQRGFMRNNLNSIAIYYRGQRFEKRQAS